MPFPLVMSLVPLLGSLVATHAIFLAAESWPSRQIAVDNEAIELGRADARALQAVEEGNRALEAQDALHHALHACGPKCKPLDLAAEAKLLIQHRAIAARAAASWKLTPAGWNRPPAPPLSPRVCPVCGLPMGWRITPLAYGTKVSDRPRIEVGVKVRKLGAQWRYRLEADRD